MDRRMGKQGRSRVEKGRGSGWRRGEGEGGGVGG